MSQPIDSSGLRRDQLGTPYTAPNPAGPVASGTAVTIHNSDGTKSPGHMVSGVAVADKKSGSSN
jgi:hypothetical protein